MLLKSSCRTVTALSIFSSASRRVSSIMVQLLCTDGGVHHGLPEARWQKPPSYRASSKPISPGGATPRTPVPPAELRLAHPEAGECLHVDLVGREQRLDGLLGVLHRRLLGEHDVLEEGTETTLDNLRNGLLGLAFLAGDLLRDPALLLDQVGRHL